MKTPVIAVLCGGTSAEREVSLGSGAASARALACHFPTELVRVDADALPAGLQAGRHVVFSTLHGTFGEDGGMQRLLDDAGIEYAGCGATASALIMDKTATKAAVARAGVTVAAGMLFAASARPSPAEVIASLGPDVVVKPNDQGSSVGLALPDSPAALATVLAQLTPGQWLIEERLRGRELSVGVIEGQALGVVEIRPRGGVYDFASKYTPGATDYLAPAPLDAAVFAHVRAQAATAYTACGCRDYARVDFILVEQGPRAGLYLLEINTLPGMKATSLLPMSARWAGLDFNALVAALVAPAVRRFQALPLVP